MRDDTSGAWGILMVMGIFVWVLTSCDGDDRGPKRECLSWTKEWDGFSNSGASCDEWR